MLVAIILWLIYNICAGTQAIHEKQITSQTAAMSDEEFLAWLHLRGVSEKDCKTLIGNQLKEISPLHHQHSAVSGPEGFHWLPLKPPSMPSS